MQANRELLAKPSIINGLDAVQGRVSWNRVGGVLGRQPTQRRRARRCTHAATAACPPRTCLPACAPHSTPGLCLSACWMASSSLPMGLTTPPTTLSPLTTAAA